MTPAERRKALLARMKKGGGGILALHMEIHDLLVYGLALLERITVALESPLERIATTLETPPCPPTPAPPDPSSGFPPSSGSS